MPPDESIGYVRDLGAPPYPSTEKKRREYGAHLTSIDIFREFILPEIKECLYHFSWVDLFACEGNLILPILDLIPQEKRADFFREHIFLYDIQPEMVEKAVANAMKYGIPQEVARENIKVRDTLQNYPDFKTSKIPSLSYHQSTLPLYRLYCEELGEESTLFYGSKRRLSGFISDCVDERFAQRSKAYDLYYPHEFPFRLLRFKQNQKGFPSFLQNQQSVYL
jgi:hypothetical protein